MKPHLPAEIFVESELHYNGGAHCGCEVFRWKTPTQSEILGRRVAIAACRMRAPFFGVISIGEEKTKHNPKESRTR